MVENMHAGVIGLSRPVPCEHSGGYVIGQLYAATPGWGNQFEISVFQTELGETDIRSTDTVEKFVEELRGKAYDQRRHEVSKHVMSKMDVIAFSLARLCAEKDGDGNEHRAERLASVILAQDTELLPLKSAMTGQGILPWIGNVIRHSKGWRENLSDQPETNVGLLPITIEEGETHEVTSIVNVASHTPTRGFIRTTSRYYMGVHTSVHDGTVIETIVPRDEVAQRTVGSILRYSV